MPQAAQRVGPLTSGRQVARILFVDDEPATRRAFVRAVARFGFLVDLARGGEEALDLAEQTQYPVIVTDLVMPGIDGISLVRRLKSRQPNCIFVILTGRPDVEIPDDPALRTGVASVLSKPWSDEELNGSLQRALRLFDARHSLRPPSLTEEWDTAPILLLEDNEADAELVRFYLRSVMPNPLRHVGRLSEALEALSSEKFGVILCDLTLPDGRGLDAVLRLQNAAPKTPLIVLSGLQDEALSTQAVQAGAQDYLGKDELNAATLGRAIRYAKERKRSEIRLAERAYFDALTGLPNRALFQQRLSHMLARSARGQQQFAVLFIDLDEFKPVNDTFGHAAGDAILVETARRLEKVVREYDTVARLGGDEFAALIDDVPSQEGAEMAAQRVLEALRQPFTFEGHRATLSASIGVAIYPEAGQQEEGLLRAADAAMYEAKRLGRNRYSVEATQSHTERPPEALSRALFRAAENGDLQLRFEPINDLQLDRVVAVQVRLYWQRAPGVLVEPDKLSEMLLGSEDAKWVQGWMVEQACEGLQRLRSRGAILARVCCEVPQAAFEDSDLAERVQAAMQASKLADGELELEISEQTLMGDTKRATRVLSELRAAGVRIAMGGFGTGFSSLACLHRLPCDLLKVDGSFVSEIGSGGEAEAIITTILGLGSGLGLDTAAPGVSCDAQRDFLAGIGCTLIQGPAVGDVNTDEQLLTRWGADDTKAHVAPPG